MRLVVQTPIGNLSSRVRLMRHCCGIAAEVYHRRLKRAHQGHPAHSHTPIERCQVSKGTRTATKVIARRYTPHRCVKSRKSPMPTEKLIPSGPCTASDLQE
jgi:hypothetical protein